MKLKEFGPWGWVHRNFYYVDLPLHMAITLNDIDLQMTFTFEQGSREYKHVVEL